MDVLAGTVKAGQTPRRIRFLTRDQYVAFRSVDTHQVVLGHDEVDIIPVHIRYSWPSEFDLMAQLVGLQLVERWANWQQEPFTL